jgi:hypothetical protein
MIYFFVETPTVGCLRQDKFISAEMPTIERLRQDGFFSDEMPIVGQR